MKKTIIFILLILVLIIVVVFVTISDKGRRQSQIETFNLSFEKFKRTNSLWCRCNDNNK